MGGPSGKAGGISRYQASRRIYPSGSLSKLTQKSENARFICFAKSIPAAVSHRLFF
jgi:hypothetical protein